MKISPAIATVLLLITFQSMAQNKTLGVGIATPNANAALHVESPTNNQGFIMPRLTSAQRTAMASLPLTAADDGLLVYDKDVKKIYVWNGSSWQLTASALSLPFSASDTSANSFTVNNTGNGNAAQFIGSGTGVAAQFSITNAGSSAPSISVTNAGSGRAIVANAPIEATQFIGDGSLLTNIAGGLILPFRDSVSTSSNAFEVTNIGVGGAGSFNNMNASSGFAALSITTIGVSNAAAITVSNPANAQPALIANSNGTGPALAVDQTNNGVALQINNGTVVHSVFNVPTGGGTITDRAGIYVLSDNLSYTFGFGVEGETVKVMSTSGDVIVETVQILGTGTIEEFVYIGGTWKMIGYCYTC